MTKRKNFLSNCLLSAAENMDFESLKSLLDLNADPSFISDRKIAPIHYIVGMEDESAKGSL